MSIAATRHQYPVCTVCSSLPQPFLHSMPKRSECPSRSDQKLKLRDEMRKIQSKHLLVRGSEGEYGSGGHICNGCVRHVRGVYESEFILSRIYKRSQLKMGKTKRKNYLNEILTYFAANFTPSPLICTRFVACIPIFSVKRSFKNIQGDMRAPLTHILSYQ